MKFDTIYDGLIKGTEKLALVGLGYVGMPIAVEFAKHISVIGFDINEKRVQEYANGIDATNEVGEAIKNTTVDFTSDPTRLKEAKFIVVAVPTPVNPDTTPDLRPVEGASRTVGQNLTPGTIVVFESTVYPGVTEDICIPIIEKESGLKCGVDWKIGYSPERINPGDRVHTLTNIRKIVSGMDEESAREIKKVYDIVIAAGTFPVSTIKTAEAVKVVENSQRDINIAFMNEVAMICDRMGIDTDEVLAGMNTKWNALGFKPGLVGGHCIGVDPYYLTNAAEALGYHSQIILNGRKVNDSMGGFVADAAIKQMIEAGVDMDNPIAARAVHDQAFFKPAFEAYRDNFKKLYDTGVTVLAGSDMVLYKAPPLPIHQELGYMVDYGITPVEAVRTATYNAASVLGIEKETGSLKEGLAGDLLVVKGDVSKNIRALDDVQEVYLAGEIVYTV